MPFRNHRVVLDMSKRCMSVRSHSSAIASCVTGSTKDKLLEHVLKDCVGVPSQFKNFALTRFKKKTGLQTIKWTVCVPNRFAPAGVESRICTKATSPDGPHRSHPHRATSCAPDTQLLEQATFQPVPLNDACGCASPSTSQSISQSRKKKKGRSEQDKKRDEGHKKRDERQKRRQKKRAEERRGDSDRGRDNKREKREKTRHNRKPTDRKQQSTKEI